MRYFLYFFGAIFALSSSQATHSPQLVLRSAKSGKTNIRLVVTSPQATEIIFQLGKGNDIVATSHFSDYPEEAKAIKRIGPIFGIGIESILAERPDWVVSDPYASSPTLELGISATELRHYPFAVTSLKELMENSSRFLERVYGETNHPQLDKFHKCVHSLDKGEPFTFLAFAWMTPPILFGSKTFLSDLLSQIGGVNLVEKQLTHPFPRLSTEWLIRHRPQVLYLLTESMNHASQAEALSHQWWPGQKVEIRILPSALFARGSFTPLRHVEFLRPGFSPEECR